MLSGLLSALFLVAVSPNVIRADGTAFIVGDPLIDLTNPAIISVPIGFLGGIIGTYLSKERNEQKYSEVKVRANIGLKKSRVITKRQRTQVRVCWRCLCLLT